MALLSERPPPGSAVEQIVGHISPEDLLYYFAQVVDHGGFAPAGRALDMPKSKLSRRIANLEERLEVRLLQRSTQHFSVTEIGQEYYRQCVAMMVEAEGAAEVIERNRSVCWGNGNTRTRVRVPTGSPIRACSLGAKPRVEKSSSAFSRRAS